MVGEFLQQDIVHISPRITVEYKPGKQLVLLYVLEEEQEPEHPDQRWVVREKLRLHALTSREDLHACLGAHGFSFDPTIRDDNICVNDEKEDEEETIV